MATDTRPHADGDDMTYAPVRTLPDLRTSHDVLSDKIAGLTQRLAATERREAALADQVAALLIRVQAMERRVLSQ